MFSYYPEDFWKLEKNQRKFFELVAKKLSIHEWKDWYSVTKEDILHHYPSFLDKVLVHYAYSLEDALITIFKEFYWTKSEFKAIREKHRTMLDTLVFPFSTSTIDEIYQFDFSSPMSRDVGKILQQYYNGQLINAVLSIYKHFDFKIWKFKHLPSSALTDARFHRFFFESIAQDLKLKNWTDWYSVNIQDIIARGGETLLHRYYYSPIAALSTLFPEYSWEFSKFNASLNTHRKLFDDIGKKIGVKSLDDWYNFAAFDIASLGAENSLKIFGGSLSTTLKNVYPEHNWRPWRFRLPNGYWDNKDNVREAVEAVGKELNIRQADDWKGVTMAQLTSSGIGSLVHKYKGIIPLLKSLYPGSFSS